MSLELMRERMKISGMNYREELMLDSQRLEQRLNDNDLSYCDEFYKVINQEEYHNEDSYEKIHPRLFSKKWNSFKNHEMKMITMCNEPIKYGDLFYNKNENSWWICIQVDFNEVEYHSKLLECNYLLYWQSEDYLIHSRYCCIFNASSYSNGETEGKVITLESNQFMCYMTYDTITDCLENDKRIHISKSSRKCKPYDLTRTDDITYGFGGMEIEGVLCIIFTQDEYQSDDDKLIDVGGKQVWICDYKCKEEEIVESVNDGIDFRKELSIEYKGKAELKIGGNSKKFKGIMKDFFGNELSEIGTWNVVYIDEVNDFIKYKINENEITISIDENPTLIGTTIRLEYITTDSLYSCYLDLKIVNIF